MIVKKRESRRIKLMRLKCFIDEYKRNKLGLLGISIFLFFVGLSTFVPIISPVDPIIDNLADSIVPPDWIVIFGGEYGDFRP
ncbi:hypothetical protein B6U74_04350 [Candidatus Bathyarchaeota archaeon ex4484_205]|nr:MAG: hypothetical protein B6U74_04350 [Candidatus Bathyarchaeota archaeon ex4484_205]RLG69111.1 MAG: hypothetical protein DRN93_01015 [archaeon]